MSEWYHASADLLSENSTMTIRSCSHPPSSAWTSLPRTRYRPPKAATVAGASFMYRRIASALRILTLETMYADMGLLVASPAWDRATTLRSLGSLHCAYR